MGHLEPAAAAAGLASLILAPLFATILAANTQLRGSVCLLTLYFAGTFLNGFLRASDCVG